VAPRSSLDAFPYLLVLAVFLAQPLSLGIGLHEQAREAVMRKNDGCTLDPGLTALALRGISKPSAYPFVERHLWRKRAVGLFVTLTRLGGRTFERKPVIQVSS
jgi:hypothetical protein